MKKINIYLILIIALASLIRLLACFRLPYLDEVVWIELLQGKWVYGYTIMHPPLFYWFLKLFYPITGEYLIRLVPALFGVGTILVLYFLVKEYYNEKVALWASFILSIMFWHVVASTMLDIDGSILTFFITLTLYCFYKYFKFGGWKWFLLTVLVMNLAFLCKNTAVLLLPILLIFVLFEREKFFKTGYILFLGCISSAVYVYWTLFNYGNQFISYNAARFVLIPTYYPLMYLVIWLGPFLLITLAYFLICKKRFNLFTLWLIIPIIFYSFMAAGTASLDRYLTIVLPAVAVLAALVLERVGVKEKGLLVVFTSLLFGIFMLIPSGPFVSHSLSNYFHAFISEVNFLLPMTGTSGPTIYISVGCLFLAMVITFIFLTAPREVKKNWAFGVAIAFSLYCIVCLLLPVPNVDHIKESMIYAYEHNSFGNSSILINHKDLRQPMDNPNIVYLQDNPVKGSYDYIFYVNYPYRNDTQVTDVLNQCELIAGFMSFDVEVGYIMKC